MAATDDDVTARPEREEKRDDRREERRDDRREERRDERREEVRADARADGRAEGRADGRGDRREHGGGDRRDDGRERDGDSLSETIRQRLEQLVPDLVKKTFAAGMGAVFQTEEGIRKLARESLPEVAGYIASSADGAKDKVFDVIARETREFLANLNVSEEIAKILTTLSFEIKTEIRFIPNSERFTGAEPDVKASVRLKRTDRDGKDEDEDSHRSIGQRLRFWQRDRDPADRDEGDSGPDR